MIIGFFVFLGGIVFSIAYNFFVIKKYPEKKRKGAYIRTILVIIPIFLLLSGVISCQVKINKEINQEFSNIEMFIKKSFPDNEFVNNGFALEKIDEAVNELLMLVPTHSDLGISKWLYDFTFDIAKKTLMFAVEQARASSTLLDSTIHAVDNSISIIRSFADDNNIITISSILAIPKAWILKYFNVRFFIAEIIILSPALLYVILTTITAFKVNKISRKKAKISEVADKVSFCEHCGNPLKLDDIYCSNCGNSKT